MDFLAIVVLVLVIANIIWGFQTHFKGGWPFWVNLIGSVILAVATFTTIC